MLPALTMILLLGVVIAGTYVTLKPHMAGWNVPEFNAANTSQRFDMFKDQWGRIFVAAFIGSALIGTLAYLLSDSNPYVGFTVGVISGLLGVASWTDAHVFKVPRELSAVTLLIGLSIMVTVFLTGTTGEFPHLSQQFYPLISWDSFWVFVGYCAVAVLVGLLVAVKSKNNILFMFGLFFMFGGLYLTFYALFSALYSQTGSDLWYHIFVAYIFLGVAAGYDLFLPRQQIGGADTVIFYTVGFAFSWWVSPYLLFVALLVAFGLQIVVHMVAKPLKLGYEKETKNGPIKQAYLNFVAKREGVEPTYTHVARAVPFVPMLFVGIIGSIFVFLV